MQTFSLFIGIDVSKLTLHISYSQATGKALYEQIDNTGQAISTFFGKLLKEHQAGQILVCCEHTGTYTSKLAAALKGSGICLWMVNALVMRYSSSSLTRYKTDKADADKIRSFAITHRDNAKDHHHPSQAGHGLKELGQVRKQLVDLRAQVLNMQANNQDKAAALALPSVLLTELISYLSNAIRQIEQAIRELIASQARLSRLYAILVSIPGIGPVTARHILQVTDLFSRFESYKAFACFVGTAPFPNQSGTSKNPKMKTSKKAYKPLKAELHQGALSVTRKGLFFHNYYQHLKQENKHHLAIINAIINQMLSLAFTLIAKDELFDKNIYLKNKKSEGFLLPLS
jgi:transposase